MLPSDKVLLPKKCPICFTELFTWDEAETHKCQPVTVDRLDKLARLARFRRRFPLGTGLEGGEGY